MLSPPRMDKKHLMLSEPVPVLDKHKNVTITPKVESHVLPNSKTHSPYIVFPIQELCYRKNKVKSKVNKVQAIVNPLTDIILKLYAVFITILFVFSAFIHIGVFQEVKFELEVKNYPEVKENVLFTDPYSNPDAVADYALATAGAEIFDSPTAVVYKTRSLNWHIFNIAQWSTNNVDKGPQSVLKPWKSPGECWAFSGSKASIRIKLSHTIIPRAVTIEHISHTVSPTGNIASAPKHFSVYALDTEGKILRDYLGTFKYVKGGSPTQSFVIHQLTRAMYPTRVIEFVFHTNHGHPDYTCVYKLRVHGELFQF